MVVENFQEILTYAPEIAKLVSGFILGAAVLFWAINFVNGKKVLTRISNHPPNNQPTLRHNRPKRHFVLTSPLKIFWIEGLALWIFSLFNRKRSEIEFIKSENVSDLAYKAAVLHVGDYSGLSFLPPKINYPLHMFLVLQRLEEIDAPTAAIQTARKDLSQVDKSRLFEAVVSTNYINEGRMDITRDSDSKTSYFFKYFQPLLISMSEDSYFESSGSTELDRKNVLVAHLKFLSDQRLRAGKFKNGEFPIKPIVLTKELPKPVPTGYKRQKKTIKEFNRKKSIRSILLITDAESLDLARFFELEIEKSLKKSPIEFDIWTPDTNTPHDHYIFLFQEKTNA